MNSKFKLIIEGIALLGIVGLLSSCGGGGGVDTTENTPFTESDLAGMWAVTKIEGIPDPVGGPSIVDESNSTFLFKLDGTYDWFFFFNDAPFFFDLQGSGTYSLSGSELTVDGVLADTILDLLPQKKITLTVSADKNTFSFLDDDNDRWTYNRIPSSLSSIIPITDENLKSCIDATGANRIDQVTSLTCVQDGLVDISGIEYLTSLTSLRLSGNASFILNGGFSISDISPLSTLTNLTSLDLSWNSIFNINPLANLTNLTFLNLAFNNIVDISPLSTLTSLTDLSLGSNGVINISPLSNLTNLTELRVGFNSISDISPLSTLTSLTDLDLSANGITDSDLSSLLTLTSLTMLDLNANSISEISALSTLTNLTGLALRFNNIVNVGPLSTLTSLITLDLGSNNITDGVASLVTLTNIISESLLLTGNNSIPCSDLDTLETALVTAFGSAVVRPISCI